MTPDEMGMSEQKIPPMPEVKIQVEFFPGRWGKVFHIFDLDNREIALHQKDACALARKILQIANRKE